MTGQLRFAVYDKTLTLQGWVAAFEQAQVTLRKDGISTAEFTTDSDHDMVEALAGDGARVVAQYRPDGVSPWVAYLSGSVQGKQGQGPEPVASRTWRVESDERDLWHMLAWQNPAGNITQQGAAGASQRLSGPAETVLKTLVSGALAHLGGNLTVATDQGRGGTVTVDVRMTQVAEAVLPALDGAGLGVRVLQSGSTRVLDVYEKTTWPTTLTEASGIVTNARYELTGPTATRVVVGAGGQDTARVYRERIDTVLEAAWGLRLEEFLDARDVDPADPNLTTVLDARADEFLAERAPKATIRCDLSETDTFRFPQFALGTVVTVQAAGGPPITETIREIVIDSTHGQGTVVTPVLGDPSDTADDLVASTLAALTAAVRFLRSSR